MSMDYENEIEKVVAVLRKGGTILYPTDTVCVLGCYAKNEEEVKNIYQIKKRDDSKSLIVLVADEKAILKYVAAPDLAVYDYLQQQVKPTTVIYHNAIGLPGCVIAKDGSVGIRIVKDDFCRHIIKRLQVPIISTSANISGSPTPQLFADISDSIKQQVDYMVKWRQTDLSPAQPSQIVKWNNNGTVTVIRS
jgi:L-threonylcarbamoyladenylate synthase